MNEMPASSPPAATSASPLCPPTAFVDHDPAATLSWQCEQVFVYARSRVPKVSILSVGTSAPAAWLCAYQGLRDADDYPNREFLVAAGNCAAGFIPSKQQAHLKNADATGLVAAGNKQTGAAASAAADAVTALLAPNGRSDTVLPALALPHRPSQSVGAALNELAQKSTGEYLWLLAPGAQPQIFALYQLMMRLKHHDEVGAVGGHLVTAQGTVCHAGMVVAGGEVQCLDAAALAALPADFSAHNREFQALSGACLLLRRADYLAVGGCSEEAGLTQHACGADLCLRLRDHLHKKTVLACAAEVTVPADAVQARCAPAQPAPQGHAQEESQLKDDLHLFTQDPQRGIRTPDLCITTCINNPTQYASHVLGSLLNNYTGKELQLVPIMNLTNAYNAASALNAGIRRSHAKVVVLCHQDVIFYKAWVEILFVRMAELGKKPWALLGTAGIRADGVTSGVVQRLDGSFDWNTRYKMPLFTVQTLDEHCMVYNKDSQVFFDEKTFDGFHFYGPDICLQAHSQGLEVLGMYNPLVHNGAGGSLVSGKKEYDRLLDNLTVKWGRKFSMIRTPTCIIKQGKPVTHLRF